MPFCFALLCFAVGQNLAIFKTTLLCSPLEIFENEKIQLCFALLEVNLNFQNGRGRGKFWPKFWHVIAIFGPFWHKIEKFSNLSLISYLLVFIHLVCSPDCRLPQYLLKCEFPILYFRNFFGKFLLCFALVCFALLCFEIWI